MRFDIPDSVRAALDTLEKSGYLAYLVGGCVRDECLGVRPHDYDIATSATPKEMHEALSRYRLIDTGVKHGTVTALIDGQPIEITTFRRDGEYADGRHPKSVTFSRALADDLSRRDFTVNAMAYSEKEGVIDLYGGLDDLKNRVIRCVGDATTRFSEDALRILRALRFMAKLGFNIEEGAFSAMLARKDTLRKVSRERVFAEMTALLTGKDAPRALVKGREIVLTALPELSESDSGAWARAIRMVSGATCDAASRWAALLSPYGEERTARAATGLRMSNEWTRRVTMAARWLDYELSVENTAYALSKISLEDLLLVLSLKRADGAPADVVDVIGREARRVLADGECVSLRQLAVNGRDIRSLGAVGADIGLLLDELLEEVTLRRAPNEKSALLSIARARMAARENLHEHT